METSPAKTLRFGCYNIEHMHRLFSKNGIVEELLPRAQAAGRQIDAVSADVLGIVEGASKLEQHRRFLSATGLDARGYAVGKSEQNRTRQDLVFYHRETVELLELDAGFEHFDTWIEDIDQDGIREVFEFDRRPLEALFRHRETGVEFLVCLISLKSKGVFSAADLHRHQLLALANRKRLIAQARRLRARIEAAMKARPGLPFVVMGDFNDDPGMDSFERVLGVSALETVMGNVYKPDEILHNALWHLTESPQWRSKLWTAEFHDEIVNADATHKVWLDHILVSPGIARGDGPMRLLPGSGCIAEKTEDALLASDHVPIWCDVGVGGDLAISGQGGTS